MKKKVVSMMMAASLVTGMLTGCGSSAAPAQTTDNGTQADASTCLLYTSPSPRD